jgi:predicted amidohydrolase
MIRMSETSGKAICGSYIARENGMCYNRFIFASPGEIPVKYDKRHLFSIAGENEKFTSGSSRTLINYGGMKIFPSICYDLRFPVWLRNRNDYDLMICVANWPESRSEVWNTLLKARAIENQCYVAGANRIGTDENGNSYSGDSCIIDPKGNIIAFVPENQEGIASAEISLAFLSEFREKFPVWKDADDFDLGL